MIKCNHFDIDNRQVELCIVIIAGSCYLVVRYDISIIDASRSRAVRDSTFFCDLKSNKDIIVGADRKSDINNGHYLIEYIRNQ